ncbi:uncharacterized protein RJT21DRAFT_46914 [Scheffersomyces amazonensis]|uniref:uncharacterized protein n=1 Tax=Scheffersomyces amazonensis TaxID=1078765 RepID=UPI00315CD158
MNELPSYPTPQQAAYRIEARKSPKIRTTSQPGQQRQQPFANPNNNPNVVYRPPGPKTSHSHSHSHPQQQQPPPQTPNQPYYQQQPQYAQPQYAPQPQYYQPQPQVAPPAPAPVAYQQQPQYPRQSNPQYYVPPQPQQQQQPPPQHPQQQQQQPPPQQQQQQQHHYVPAPEHYQDNYSDVQSQSSRKPPPQFHNKSKESLEPSSKISKEELRALFDRTDTNRSGRISARELTALLSNLDNSRFNDHTIVLLIKLFNQKGSSSSASSPTTTTASQQVTFNSASLTFEQFCSLWKYIYDYRKLFKQADSDGSGDISFGEFQEILGKIGYKLNIDLILNIFTKFSYKDVNEFSYNNPTNLIGKLKFDSFIELLAYLSTLTDIFKKYDKGMVGVANIKYSDFLQEIINIP